MTETLKTASEIALQLLVIATAVSVPVLLLRAWGIARRYQLVVAELVNSTADAQLDPATRGLTQLARQRIDAEVRVVARRRETLHTALGGAGRRSSRTIARVQQRLDDRLGELVSMAREVAPQPAQPAVALFSSLVARPRGLMVAGILQSRGRTEAPRLGVSLDVLHLDGDRSVASQTFWEPDGPVTGDGLSAAERLIRLLAPAARWAAIRLVVESVFSGRVRRGEQGLDHLLCGVLYAQSAGAFPPYAAVFSRRAAEELEEAAEQLASDVPLPLAALADTLDRLAADPHNGSAALFAQAHVQYARALEAMTAQRPRPDDLIEKYRVREATSWLASGLEEPKRRALDRLATERPRADGEALPATDLYDAACLYALAAEAGGGDGELRTTSLRLLARALALDAGSGRTLWEQAPRDPQLEVVASDLAVLLHALEAELASEGGAADPEAVSDRAFAAAANLRA